MSKMAALPCFKCGREIENVWEHCDNQPYGATEFRTQGHYGSTFWDSWDSYDKEDLILNVCDECLTEHTARLGLQKPNDDLVRPWPRPAEGPELHL